MNLEDQVFQRKHPDYNKLKEYGFIEKKGIFFYEKEIDDEFKAVIQINDGKLTGKVIDLNFDEEYINYRLEGKLGEFASKIKYEYLTLLDDLALHCFVDDYFIFDQSNRIAKYVGNRYHYEPQFIFEKSPEIGVFKHENNKWFGLVMVVDYPKIDENKKGQIEILNLKVEEDQMDEILKIDGIYPSYHMSKKSWISIVLDERVEDETIISLLDKSYSLIDDHLNYKEWIVPGNAGYFDIENMFEYQNEHIWKQSTNVHIGDIVYIYASKPFSCVLFQCKVLQVDIPYRFKKDQSIQYVMNLAHLHSYEFGEFSLERLKGYGVTTIRGPRHIPDQLSVDLNKYREEK